MVPGKGRTPWREIGEALRDIQYDKTVVMEPFVMPGGTVGQNIKIWRDIVPDTSEEALVGMLRQHWNLNVICLVKQEEAA